jgi:hypothetical protein
MIKRHLLSTEARFRHAYANISDIYAWYYSDLHAPEGAYGVRPEITDLRVRLEAETGPKRAARA